MDALDPQNPNPPPRPDEPGAEPGGTPLYSVVYCSRASLGDDRFALDRIVAKAQRSNPAQAITGVLVFGGGVFFQWLEGPRARVEALMSRIRADPRHDDVVVLSESEEVRDRLFPHWSMELVSSSDIREVLQDAHGTARDSPSVQALSGLLAQLDAGTLEG